MNYSGIIKSRNEIRHSIHELKKAASLKINEENKRFDEENKRFNEEKRLRYQAHQQEIECIKSDLEEQKQAYLKELDELELEMAYLREAQLMAD